MKNLIIFPGWNRNEKTYKKLIKLAPQEWNIYCLAYDRLIPSGNAEKLNKKVLEFLKEKNIEKASILGISLGGALAIKFVNNYPGKVEHLFLVDSEGVYTKANPFKVLKNIFFDASAYLRFWENIRALFYVLGNPLLCIKLGIFANYANLGEEAEGIQIPTTIIWGKEDKVIPVEQGNKLHALIKNSKLVVLFGMGHDWIAKFPEKFWSSWEK